MNNLLKKLYFKHIYFFILSCLIISLLILPKSSLWAEGEKISISVREEYSDNLFLQKNDKKNSYLTTLEGGIKIPPKSKRRGISIEYKGKLNYYKDWSQYDHSEDEADINFNFGFNRRETFSIKLNERRYYRDKITYWFDEPRNLIGVDIIDVTPSLNLLIGRGDLNIGYRHIEKTYHDKFTNPNQNAQFTDSEDRNAFFELNQEIGHRISLILGYTYLNRDFKWKDPNYQPAEYDEQEANIGLSFDMQWDINIQIKYGYVWREYDQGGDTEYSTFEGDLKKALGKRLEAGFSYSKGRFEEEGEYIYGTKNDYHNWSGNTTITLKKGHKLSANYGEGYYQYINGTMSKRKTGKIGMSHDFHEKIKLTYDGYDIRDEYEEENRKESSQGGEVSLELFPTRRFSFSLYGDYEEKDHRPIGWWDRSTELEAGIHYLITSQVATGCTYTYLKNTSNEDWRNHECNRYGVYIRGNF